MENTGTIKKERLMTKPFFINRKITKVMMIAIILALLAMGAYFGYWASVRFAEAKWIQLIQSDNTTVTPVSVTKK